MLDYLRLLGNLAHDGRVSCGVAVVFLEGSQWQQLQVYGWRNISSRLPTRVDESQPIH